MLSGSAGNDSIVLSASAEEGDTFDGLGGVDTVKFSDENDFISITATETILAGGGNDVLTITTNDTDFVSGGDGSDQVVFTSEDENTVTLNSIETVVGGAGNDTFTVSDETAFSVGLPSEVASGDIIELLLDAPSNRVEAGIIKLSVTVDSNASPPISELLDVANSLVTQISASLDDQGGSLGLSSQVVPANDGTLVLNVNSPGEFALSSIGLVHHEALEINTSVLNTEEHVSTVVLQTDVTSLVGLDATRLSVFISGEGLTAPLDFDFDFSGFESALELETALQSELTSRLSSQNIDIDLSVDVETVDNELSVVLRSNDSTLDTGFEIVNSFVDLTENDEFAELKIPDNDAVSGKFELTISGLPTDAGSVTLSKIADEGETITDIANSFASQISELSQDQEGLNKLAAEVSKSAGGEVNLKILADGFSLASVRLSHTEALPVTTDVIQKSNHLSTVEIPADTKVSELSDSSLLGVLVSGGGLSDPLDFEIPLAELETGADFATVLKEAVESRLSTSGSDISVTLSAPDNGNVVTLQSLEGNVSLDLVIKSSATAEVVGAIKNSTTLDGGLGDDTLLGGSGDDTFIGGDGSDVLVGGPDDGLPGSDADVAVFEGSKGSYEFGVDAVSGSLTVTSKDTGSVDILEGIETLSFGDGPLTVSQTPDAAFFESQLALPSGLQVGDRVEFALTGVEGLDDGVSISIELSSDADIASLSETLRSIISTSIADSSLEVVSNQEDLGSGITLRSSEAFDVSLSRVSHVIEDIFSSIVVASLGEDEATIESDAETQIAMRPRFLKLKIRLWLESSIRPQILRMLKPFHLMFMN